MKYLEDVRSKAGTFSSTSRMRTSTGTSVPSDGTPESSARTKNWNTSLAAKETKQHPSDRFQWDWNVLSCLLQFTQFDGKVFQEELTGGRIDVENLRRPGLVRIVNAVRDSSSIVDVRIDCLDLKLTRKKKKNYKNLFIKKNNNKQN